MIDFEPIEVKEIGLHAIKKRKKEPEGSFNLTHKSSIKDNRGIAELFAS